MKKRARRLLFAFVPLLVACAAQSSAAQSRGSANTLKLDDPALAPKAAIKDVSWITGDWAGEAFGGVSEEVWSAPQAGTMMGMFRLITNGKVAFYELMTIVEENASLVLKLKHFHADLGGWEEKDGSSAVKFPLVKLTPDAAYFHGLTFRKAGDGSLQVFVLSGSKGAEPKEVEFRFVPREKLKGAASK